MKKLFLLMLCISLLLSSAFALAEPLRVGALKGPTAMGLVKLMKDSEGKDDYAFTLAASPDALLPEFMRGSLDFACLPVNLAAILYANTKGVVRVVNINTLGVFYILERGDSVMALADLSGRTLYASGKASTPEYALNHLLAKAGVGDVDIQWKAEHQEVLAALMMDEKGLAFLPQPFVAAAQAKNPGIRVALDLNREWEALGEGALITGVTVAWADYLAEEPEKTARFLRDYQASVDYVNADAAEAAALVGGYGIIAAEIAEKALPLCNIAFIAGERMAELLAPFYQVLYDGNPAATGGGLPDEAFYYTP